MAVASYHTTTSSTGETWIRWCSSTTSTSATISTSETWSTWCDASTTASTCSTVWMYWNEESGQYTQAAQPPPARVENEEQRAERLRQAEERAARWKAEAEESAKRAEEERQRREAAEARAEKLLLEHLSDEQRADYRKHRHFVVHGRRARYRIRYGRAANIDVVNRDGRISHRYCAHPYECVPNPDTMLAQKLMLESDEDAFARIANRHSDYGSNGAPVLPALH